MTLSKIHETAGQAEMLPPEELVFPEEYFCKMEEVPRDHLTANEHHVSVLEFSIDDRRLEKLKKIAIWLEVELAELLLGAYFYLLGEISEQPVIVVQTMIAGSGQVFPLRAPHRGIANLPDLVRMLKQKCADPSKPGLYSLTQLGNGQLKKYEYEIIPFFTWDPAKPATAQQAAAQQVKAHQFMAQLIEAQFDLGLYLHRVPEARTRAGRVSFSCGFNHQRLRKDMVEKFIQAYFNLIDIMIEKMDCGGLLR